MAALQPQGVGCINVLLDYCLNKYQPFSLDTNAFNADLWANVIVTQPAVQESYMGFIEGLLDKHIGRVREFADARDSSGRRAIDIALPKIKEAMEVRILFMRRYDLKEGPAEHTSSTCIVRLATDRKLEGKTVALKFMRDKDQFRREIDVRATCDLDNQYVINMLCGYDGDEDLLYLEEATKKSLYCYCMVMPAAERNLGAVLAFEGGQIYRV